MSNFIPTVDQEAIRINNCKDLLFQQIMRRISTETQRANGLDILRLKTSVVGLLKWLLQENYLTPSQINEELEGIYLLFDYITSCIMEAQDEMQNMSPISTRG